MLLFIVQEWFGDLLFERFGLIISRIFPGPTFGPLLDNFWRAFKPLLESFFIDFGICFVWFKVTKMNRNRDRESERQT